MASVTYGLPPSASGSHQREGQAGGQQLQQAEEVASDGCRGQARGQAHGEPDDQAGHCHQTGSRPEDLAEKDLAWRWINQTSEKKPRVLQWLLLRICGAGTNDSDSWVTGSIADPRHLPAHHSWPCHNTCLIPKFRAGWGLASNQERFDPSELCVIIYRDTG